MHEPIDRLNLVSPPVLNPDADMVRVQGRELTLADAERAGFIRLNTAGGQVVGFWYTATGERGIPSRVTLADGTVHTVR